MKLEYLENSCFVDTVNLPDDGNGIRVVAVDDEPDVVDTVVQLMQDFGFEIVGETDAATAITLVKNFKPDVIILDIMMPGMDGYEFARRILSDDETRQIPIVYLTSKGIRDDLCRSFAQGGTMYVKKPFLAEELADSLRIAISLAKAF